MARHHGAFNCAPDGLSPQVPSRGCDAQHPPCSSRPIRTDAQSDPIVSGSPGLFPHSAAGTHDTTLRGAQRHTWDRWEACLGPSGEDPSAYELSQTPGVMTM